MAETKGLLTKYLKEIAVEIDEEKKEPYIKLMAKNMIEFASGKAGAAREQIAAFNTVIERIDGKVRTEIDMAFFDSYPSQVDEEKLLKMYATQEVKEKTEEELN